MSRYVAFLRAINLGAKRRVAMADLREVFESLGYDEVSTYIASGNVLFAATGKAADLERAIEPALAERFGFEIPTIVRTPAQIRKAVELEPFTDLADGDTWSITFLRTAPTPAARKAVAALSNDTDLLEVHGAELHWAVRKGGRANVSVTDKALDRALGGIPGTNRSTTMLRKLLERA